MALIVRRALGARTVLVANSVTAALRVLERNRRVAVLVSNYRLKDGTARKLFQAASRRWPRIRRVLYDDTPHRKTANAQLAVQLADAVADDFAELRRIVCG